jgi:hypothetical protein
LGNGVIPARTLFRRRSSAYFSQAYQRIPSEFKDKPETFIHPISTENANKPPTPCTTLFVRPTTDVVSASFTRVHTYVA